MTFDPLEGVNDQIAKLWATSEDGPVMRWATVVTASPLTVLLDPGIGDPAPATSATGGVSVGARVYCVEQHRRVTVISAKSTGWKNVSSGFASGFTTGGTPGQLAYLIQDDTVYWRGGVNGTFPSGEYTTFLTNFPTEARPKSSVPLRFSGAGNGANPMFFEIHSDGHMVAAHISGSNRVWGAFSTSYPRA